MQKVISFSVNLNQFGEYKFTELFFRDDYAPSMFTQSGHDSGTYYRQKTIIDGSNTYVFFGLGRFNEEQLARLEENWRTYQSDL